MWQKATVVRGDRDFIGVHLWVTGKPKASVVKEWAEGRVIAIGAVVRSIQSSLFMSDGSPFFVDIEDVELLPECAEDVPLISWDEFLKGDV